MKKYDEDDNYSSSMHSDFPNLTTFSNMDTFSNVKPAERIEILKGEAIAMDGLVEAMSRVKDSVDICGNSLTPIICTVIGRIKGEYIKLKKRGVKIRFLTEITKENLDYCKELMQYVELRHLDGIRSNMAVSETDYFVISKVNWVAKSVSQTIYSNIDTISEQQHYFFENLWTKSITAESRIKEIEEGFEPIKTEILKNKADISSKIIDLVNRSKKLCICSTVEDMQTVHSEFYQTNQDIVERYRNRNHIEIRWITSINHQQDIEIVKRFLKVGINIRHVKDMPFLNFALSDKMFISTIEKIQNGLLVNNLLSSNDPLYLEHYDAVFENLWKKGVHIEGRIKDIEEGHILDIELLPNPNESIAFVNELSTLAKEEILILLSSAKGFLRTEKTDAFRVLNKLAQKGLKVKILNPTDVKLQQIVDQLKLKYSHIEFRSLQFSLQTILGLTILDRNKAMVFEIKDDEKEAFSEAVGLAIFIEGKSVALPYAAIFDNLWQQTELYEKLQLHDKLMQEFINIAAHEIRTPIQPILGLSQILSVNGEDIGDKEMINVILRNAKRLVDLTDKILDVTRIENNSLDLHKEKFELEQLIFHIIKNYQRRTELGKIEIRYFNNIRDGLDDDVNRILVNADKNRIEQIISNLINNSLKFMKEEGTIEIITEKRKENEDKEIVVVSIKDTGKGIHKEMLPKLFTKFASKSFQGTGLGLYISRKIIEAHGGKIWAENNNDDKGATFSFSLPIECACYDKE